MRISDWSSDVCSSDLQTRCVEIYGGSGFDLFVRHFCFREIERMVLRDARDEADEGFGDMACTPGKALPVDRPVPRPIGSEREEAFGASTEGRRVGKEVCRPWRYRWVPYNKKKK